MTDNAWEYVNNCSLRELLAQRGITHKRTRLYRPQTNGKIGRFHQTMGTEWAYGMTYASARARARALPFWLHHYNERRPHSARGAGSDQPGAFGTSVGTTSKIGGVMRGISARGLGAVLLCILLAFVVLPVVGLPYAADDLANRAWALYGIGDQWAEMLNLTGQWMDTQGRFFLGSSIYGFVVWNVFDSRVAYMVFLALLGFTCFALLALAVWRATRSALVAALALLSIGACWQFRFVYLDGLTSFAGLVLYTLALTVGSALLAARILRGGSRWLALPLGILWALAVTSYEVSLLMLPAIGVMLYATGPPLRERTRWLWAGLPLLVPALVEVAITMVLRVGAPAPASAYDINFTGPVGTTFLKQLLAAIPFSQQLLGDAPLNATVALMLIAALAVPIALAWRPLSAVAAPIPDRVGLALIIAGAWAWVVPAALAAVTQRWQDELVWGQGYIYVGYQFVGLALIAAGLVSLMLARADRRWARVALYAVFVLMAVACAVTAASNLTVLSAVVPGPQGPA